MYLTTFVSSVSDIDNIAQTEEVTEVLLEPRELAFEGRISLEQVMELAAKARERNLAPVLVWDILMSEAITKDVFEIVSKIDLASFSAVRVRDIGAAQFLFENYPSVALQLSVEADNHNLDGLRGWCEYFGDRLKRLILSIELPEEKLIEYCQTLPVPCEVLGAGRIQLFYSPRALLSKHFESKTDWIEVTGSAEDSGRRPFPILETIHGTMMFLDKDQFILDKLAGLEQAGCEAIRIDLKHLSSDGSSAEGILELCQQFRAKDPTIRKTWPRKTLAPFFKTNKTTARFSKLKSPLHVMRDESCLAQIVYGEKGKYVVFYTLRSFQVKQADAIVLSTGEQLEVEQLSFTSTDGELLSEVEANTIVVTPWIKKASNGALLKAKAEVVLA